jgi:hypothetical protein
MITAEEVTRRGFRNVEGLKFTTHQVPKKGFYVGKQGEIKKVRLYYEFQVVVG